MKKINRPSPFVLVSTNHGSFLVNRNDYHSAGNEYYGVGCMLLNTSSFDPDEVDMTLSILEECRKINGLGVVAIDCGANIGVFSVEWARHMFGWGEVVAFEAQEKIFYALAGNMVLNNCLNAQVFHAAVGQECGVIPIPVPNYYKPASYGSLELKQSKDSEFIGQTFSPSSYQNVRVVTIDSLNLARLDFMKIDVEGMEMEVLEGARNTISRCKPTMIIEMIKCDYDRLQTVLKELCYVTFPLGINLVALPRDSQMLEVFKRRLLVEPKMSMVCS